MKDSYEQIVDNIKTKLEDAQSSTKLETTKDLLEDAMSIINSFKPSEGVGNGVSKSEFDEKIAELKQKEIPKVNR